MVFVAVMADHQSDIGQVSTASCRVAHPAMRFEHIQVNVDKTYMKNAHRKKKKKIVVSRRMARFPYVGRRFQQIQI